jgi:hypothetical protein
MIVRVSQVYHHSISWANTSLQHFRNTLVYIQERKDAPIEDADEARPDWEAVDIAGACLKMALA